MKTLFCRAFVNTGSTSNRFWWGKAPCLPQPCHCLRLLFDLPAGTSQAEHALTQAISECRHKGALFGA
eukprot:1157652-Pelagomonas_calceolata.AAC.13